MLLADCFTDLRCSFTDEGNGMSHTVCRQVIVEVRTSFPLQSRAQLAGFIEHIQ